MRWRRSVADAGRAISSAAAGGCSGRSSVKLSMATSRYTLTAASLSGVIYESSARGNSPLAGAVIYCELCGEITHTWATTDVNGVYRFPGELANGGGVWLAPGKPTPIIVGGVGFDLQTWVRQDLNVLIAGDTRLDVVLLRR